MVAGEKIKDLEFQAIPGDQAYQRLPVSGPVMLIALPTPARDYLCLSITSFCFCILLAIPALLFSLKVGAAQLPGSPFKDCFVFPRGSFNSRGLFSSTLSS